MKKLSVLLIGMLVAAASALAGPAYPGWIRYTQPDGSVIVIRMHGDEFAHWVTDDNGRVVAQDADGFYRVVEGVDAATVAQTASERGAARRQIRSRQARSGHVAEGQKHFLVILCAFKDKAFTTASPNQTVTDQLNQQGYSGNGATGSARDFYYENSNGYFEPIFDVYGPVTLPENMSYYGGNDSNGYDKNPEQAIVDGCKGLDSEIDFSQYDNDGDGRVDLVFMIYAGYGEADGGGANTIWPHQWELSSAGKSLTLDGKQIDRYACSNELCKTGALKDKLDGIGTVCHEFGHAMGLPDMYDTDYETNGIAGGLYGFSTMDSGCYNNDGRTPPFFNVEERIYLGWQDEATAYLTFTNNGEVTIPAFDPAGGKTVAYRTPTDQDGEYFVYEVRGEVSWDQSIGGAGLLVYHADKSGRTVYVPGSGNVAASQLWSNWEAHNYLNGNGSHPCFYIIPAASQSSLNYKGSSSAFFFPGSGSKSSYTPESWNSVSGDISFSGISYTAGKGVTLTVSGVVDPTVSPVDYHIISNPGKGVYAAGSAFDLQLLTAADRPAQSVAWYFDGQPVSAESVTLTSGSHKVEAVVTLQDGKTDRVTLEIKAQ